MVVTEEGKYLFVHKVVKKISEKTSHAASSELFVNMFSHNSLCLALKIC